MKTPAIQRNKVFASLFVLAVSAGFGQAYAAEQPVHVRGTVGTVSADSFTVSTASGMKTIHLTPTTRVAGVVPSDLKAIKPGTFIGTANVDSRGSARALEVVVFPASMKGTGLGNYAWDLPATRGGGSSSMTNGTVKSSHMGGSMMHSSMTNGTVKSSSMGGSMMHSSMTNGTVKKASHAGEMQLLVNYGKGEKTVNVPSNVPIVAFQPADKSAIARGEHVFVVAAPGTTMNAIFVAAGQNGTIPPM